MAKVEFDTPELREYPEIPVVTAGTMAHSAPFVAKLDHQEPLGFPGELVDDWQNVAIAKMGELLSSVVEMVGPRRWVPARWQRVER